MEYPSSKPDQAGHSLVEMLVSVAILLMVVASVVSALMLGESSGRLAIQSTDQNQQLRAAMKLIADDFAFGRYQSASANKFTLKVGQPVVKKTAAFDWGAVSPDWKGDLTEWAPLTVDYSLENGNLMRIVTFHRTSEQVEYSRVAVVTGLDEASFIRPDPGSPKRIQIRLSLKPAGVIRSVAVYGEFYARDPH